MKDADSKSRAKQEMEEAKSRAEACYAQMYECARHDVKDFKDDALMHFAQAEGIAQELGLKEEVLELKKKTEHIMAVYRQLAV